MREECSRKKRKNFWIRVRTRVKKVRETKGKREWGPARVQTRGKETKGGLFYLLISQQKKGGEEKKKQAGRRQPREPGPVAWRILMKRPI